MADRSARRATDDERGQGERLPEPMALELIHLTLIVVALSILVHGVSVEPLMGRFGGQRKAP